MAVLEYKCPSCGGVVEYNPNNQQMTCPYCQTTYEVSVLKEYNEAIQPEDIKEEEFAFQNEELLEDGLSFYRCESCGGEIITEETTGATSCPFCGNPVIIPTAFTGILKPDLVIPFKLSKQKAVESLTKHYQGKRFLPNVFKDRNHLEEVKGVYVPFWLFDFNSSAHANYKASRIRSYTRGEYQYTETSTFLASRAGNMEFNYIPLDGSSKMPDILMESIEPFNLNEGVDFETAYLSGFLADKYDVDSKECLPRVNERAKSSISNALRNTVIGYSSVYEQDCVVAMNKGKVRYALLPVWLLNTTWNDKRYTFAMNGQTGKFVGDLPVDKSMFWKMFFKLGVIGSIIATIIASFVV